MSDVKMLLTKETTCIEQVLRLDTIFPSMDVYEDAFYEKVKASLKEEGLLRPLVVLPISVKDWLMLMEDNSEMLPPPPNYTENDVILQVRCGNNRYWAAKDLGIKLITVTKVASLQEGSTICKAQQKEMKQWQETTERWKK